MILKRTALNLPLCERKGHDKLLQILMKTVLESNAENTMSWVFFVNKSALMDRIREGRVLYVAKFIICLSEYTCLLYPATESTNHYAAY